MSSVTSTMQETLRDEPDDKRRLDTYDPAFFDTLSRIEERHFWFRARNNLIGAVCKRLGQRFRPGYRMLEVGCGAGNVLRMLDKTCSRGTVYGMDLFGEGLGYAKQRSHAHLLQGDMRAAPFREAFDIIGLFDVLEHLPNDRQILSDLHGMLAEGGYLILSVPASQSLWSYFDDAAHHCRRYEAVELQDKLVAAGYRVLHCTPFMMSLFPLVWSGRRLAALKRRGRQTGSSRSAELAADELRVIPVVNELLLSFLKLEMFWTTRWRRLPFGTSLLVVACKS